MQTAMSLIEAVHNVALVDVPRPSPGVSTIVDAKWPPDFTDSTPTTYEVRRYHPPDSHLTLYRLVLPSGAVPVAASVEQAKDGIPLGTIAFHPERLLTELQHTPIRRLEHLGSEPVAAR
jgi:hypothetical protein